MRSPLAHRTKTSTFPNRKSNENNKKTNSLKTRSKPIIKLLRLELLPVGIEQQRAQSDKLSKRLSRAAGGGEGEEISSTATADSSIVVVAAQPLSSPPNVDGAMVAPALTEPMSPTEKLENSSAAAVTSTVTPTISAGTTTTPTTRSTSRHKQVGVDKQPSECVEPTTSAASVTAAATPNTPAASSSKENKRNRTVSSSTATTPSSTSTRMTRSKDAAFQRVFEQAVTPSAPVSAPATASAATPSKETTQKNNNNNEQTSANATLNNNNNNSKNEANVDATVIAVASSDENCKDNSTEQLLADLTDDFEETITAEICLRKQLVDVNLEKSGGATPTDNNTTDVSSAVNKSLKENLVNKAKSVLPGKKFTALPNIVDKANASATAHLNDIKHTADAADDVANKKEKEAEIEDATTAVEIETASASSTISTISPQKSDIAPISRAQIISVEELPPISTDSTMTASEVEDNLEERLSQLDGTAVVPLTSDELVSPIDSAVAHVDEVNMTIVPQQQQQQEQQQLSPVTPPRIQQQQIAQLQHQLQLTPQTPTMTGGSGVNTTTTQSYTPQSTTSTTSVNTLAACGSGAGDVELQDGDLEEVLKALKTFDPANTSGDALGEFNSLFSDIVYSTLSYDEVGSLQAPGSSTASAITGTATASVSATTALSPPPINPLKDVQAEIERTQQTMQRKIDFLVRRMRKVQARSMCRQTSEEVAGLFEWSARIANKRAAGGAGEMAPPTIQTPPPQKQQQLSIIAARPPAHSWSEVVQKNPVPSAQMSAVLRKVEISANAQQLCTTPSTAYASSSSSSSIAANAQLKRSKKALAAAAVAAQEAAAASSTGGAAAAIVVPTFDANVTEEITHVAGLLQSEMREVQNAIDSDATESSSGGESADEMVTYNNQLQQPLSIAKRAAWRYSRDRAAIASRWSWLLSQIADLEIKIRQHSELHQELVRTKGAVITCASEATASAKLAASFAETHTSSSASLNGYKGDMLRNGGLVAATATSDDVDGSCRTRGFIASQFRKRKLLQTMNIHNVSKKAARPSTIKCGCQWPMLPCGLCTGRLDPTSPRDLPDTMMTSDRVALLDGCYHPVLSFPEDVSNSIQFEAVARLPEFQQRIMRCQVKSIARSVWKAEREASAAAGHHRHASSSTSKRYSGGESTTKRRYIKKKDRIAAEAAAAATAASTSMMQNDGAAGNGTSNLSSPSSTTPLVANKTTTKNATRKIQMAGDRVQLEPVSPLATNHSQHSQISNNYIHLTSDYPLPSSSTVQNHLFEQFNPNQTHLSLISNTNNSSSKNSKLRKLSASTSNYHQNINNHNNHHYQHYNSNNNQYYHQLSNGNSSESHLLHTNENWDSFATRSRTASPTHGGSSNYYKYERSLDRKNRSSYDIDNIVIPYSVAATTRVEILQYKEIPTPKWRVIEDNNEENNSDDSSSNQNNSAEAKEMAKENCSNNLSVETIAINTAKSTTTAVPTTLTTKNVAAEESSESNDIVATSKEIEMNDINRVTATEEKVKTKNKSPAAAEKKNNNILNSAAVAAIANKEKHRPCEKKEKLSADIPTITAKQDEKDEDIECIPPIKKSRIKEVKAPAAKAAPISICTVVETSNESDVSINHNDDVKADKSRSTNDSYDSAEDGEEEDISDEASILRHERALTEERRKFQTFLKFPYSTRSRANRRIDSRAESSGANTPDPASPAPNTPSVGGGDQDSISSPLAPSTPLNPLDSISEAGENVLANAIPTVASLTGTATTSAGVFNCDDSKRLERRRTTSTKKDRDATSERRSLTPDPRELIPPYEPLPFPLPDEVFDSLLQVMPNEYQDDSKNFEDCYTTITSTPFTYTNIKPPIRHPVRNISKNDASGSFVATKQRYNPKTSTSTNYTDGASSGGKRKKTISSTSHKSGPIDGVASSDFLQYEENGKEDDAAVDEEEEDDEDDDYPKHHLAPDDSIYDNGVIGGVGEGVSGHLDDLDDEYGAYVGRRGRNMLDESDGESSETEPFQDDDPNDPEWKGESEERSERVRKKL